MLNHHLALKERDEKAQLRISSPAKPPPAGGNGGMTAHGTSADEEDDWANCDRQVRYLQLEMTSLKKENRQLRQEKRSVETVYQQLVRPPPPPRTPHTRARTDTALTTKRPHNAHPIPHNTPREGGAASHKRLDRLTAC